MSLDEILDLTAVARFLYSCFLIKYVQSQLFYQNKPRWTSGSPRMLLALVREFESRRGEILNLFAK